VRHIFTGEYDRILERYLVTIDIIYFARPTDIFAHKWLVLNIRQSGDGAEKKNGCGAHHGVRDLRLSTMMLSSMEYGDKAGLTTTD